MDAVVRQHRFTHRDVEAMAASGILSDDARVELLDGRLIEMPPISPGHSGTVNRIASLISRALGDKYLVSVQNPVVLDDYSMPCPDIAVLKPRGDFYAARHPRPEDVVLLIEVSRSSIEFDRREKLPRYAQAGIDVVWIVNYGSRVIEVYADSGEGGWERSDVIESGEIAMPGNGKLRFAVEDLVG